MDPSTTIDVADIGGILYAPLWLGVGRPAQRPFQEIVDWAIPTATLQSQELSTHLSFESFSPYGWRCCVYSSEHGGWQNNFENVFPEVAAYIEHLPTTKDDLLILMLCTRPEKEGVGDIVEFFNTEVPHMDPDRRLPLGMRYYMWHDDRPRLQWRKVRSPFQSFYQKKIAKADEQGIGIEFDPNHCTKPVYAPALEGCHAWVLSNILAPHNVDVADLPHRCLLSIRGLDYSRLEHIVAESIPKYPNNILTMDDL